MSTPISINTALCLSASDVAALGKGRMIAALSRTFIGSAAQQFALCPIDQQGNGSITLISLWAKLEFCNIYNNSEDVAKLAKLTIWPNENLQNKLQERRNLFVLCLRVFKAPRAIALSTGNLNLSKTGGFVKLPHPLSTSHSAPVLRDDVFQQRKEQLNHLEAPSHPEIEELQRTIAELAVHGEKAKDLDDFLQCFLGWKNSTSARKIKPELAWIDEIDSLGTRSNELDEGKSNYQAGTDFENIVRDGLQFLGFSIDASHKGGAGGLDLFCSTPYPLVGECKAGKKIPSGTIEELLKLGGMHLKDQFSIATKLIIGPGNPTPDVLTAATHWKISIINPMSLQKLVELQAKYPGSINLIDLKEYLKPGQVDYKIDEYIEKVLGDINLRSYIVQIVKKHLKQAKATDAKVDTLFGAYLASNPPQNLAQKDLYDILIELSSPLAGYLGRRKGRYGGDRFYFLRDMDEIDESEP